MGVVIVALGVGGSGAWAQQEAESRPIATSQAFVLPEAVASFGAAMIGDELFVVGGHVGLEHAHSTENVAAAVRRRKIAEGGSWSTEAGPGLQGLAVVAHGESLIRIGGMAPRNGALEQEDLWSVDEVAARGARTAEWKALPPLPRARSSHDAAIVGSTVVVAGGWTLAGKEKTWAEAACVLDLAAETPAWINVPQPFKRRALALAAKDGRVYAIGGIDEDGEPSARVDVFHVAERRWERGPDLPWPAFGAGAYGDERILVASAISGEVAKLDASGNVWTAIGALAVPRFFHRIVRAPEGDLLFVGGAGKDGHVRLVERFDPNADPAAPRYVRLQLPWPGAGKNRQAAVMSGRGMTLLGGNRSLGQHDFAPENFVDEAWRLDLGTLETTRAEPLPARRQSLVVAEPAVVSARDGGPARRKKGDSRPAERPITLLGGFGSEKAGAERSFADAFTWRTGAPVALSPVALPAPLTQFGVAVHGGRTFVFGGLDYDAARGDDGAFRHSDQIFVAPDGGAFEDAGVRMPTPRRAFGHAAQDGVFYAAGGLEDGFKVVDDFAAFDLATKTWTARTKPSPRISPELVAVGGALWLAGGSNRAAPPPFLERYDVAADAWSVVTTDPPFSPVHLRVAVHRGRLLFWSTHRKDAVIDLAWLVIPRSMS